MKILVTGSAGFIGSHLVERLLGDGHQVVGFDDFSNGFRLNVDRISGEYEFIEGDLRDADSVRRATRDVEVVFHEGALGSVPRSVADPYTSMDVNTMGTLNVLNAAQENGVRRVIYASSSSVYGDNEVSPKHEGLKPNPLSPYAVSKLSAEQLCQVFSRIYGLETVSFRYFNVFGPFQNPQSQYAAVVPKFLTALSNGERPTIYGDGLQSRGFTYVDNVVDGNVLALTTAAAVGEVMNLAADTTVTVLDMLKLIAQNMGVEANPIFEPPRTGDIRNSQADITLAKTVLGWQPKVNFEEGIRRTVQSFLKHKVGD